MFISQCICIVTYMFVMCTEELVSTNLNVCIVSDHMYVHTNC